MAVGLSQCYLITSLSYTEAWSVSRQKIANFSWREKYWAFLLGWRDKLVLFLSKENLRVSCQGYYRSFLKSKFLHGPRRLLHYRYNNSLDNEQSAMCYLLVWDDVVYAIREVLSRSGSLQTRTVSICSRVTGRRVSATRPFVLSSRSRSRRSREEDESREKKQQ